MKPLSLPTKTRSKPHLLLIALLLLLTPRPLHSTGILHGVLHVTSFTPNVLTHKYNLKSSYSAYLKSMYNDQPNQNALEFKLPVQVHVYRKQRQDGSWHMQNYVQLPFPVYYDHMRAFTLKNKNCEQLHDEDYEGQIDAIVVDYNMDQREDDGIEHTFEGDLKETQNIHNMVSSYLTDNLTSVYDVADLIKKKKQKMDQQQLIKSCKDVSEGEGFVFLFDNPVSEGMLRLHARKEPERIVPRHRLFYHLNQGLELYFMTGEHNDLVTRFDEGDMVGDMFGAVLHTLKFPHMGHFSANFYIDRVERFDLNLETQLKLVNKHVSDLSAEELEKMAYQTFHTLEVDLEDAEGEDQIGDEDFDLDFRISEEDKLVSLSLEQSFEGSNTHFFILV